MDWPAETMYIYIYICIIMHKVLATRGNSDDIEMHSTILRDYHTNIRFVKNNENRNIYVRYGTCEIYIIY